MQIFHSIYTGQISLSSQGLAFHFGGIEFLLCLLQNTHVTVYKHCKQIRNCGPEEKYKTYQSLLIPKIDPIQVSGLLGIFLLALLTH